MLRNYKFRNFVKERICQVYDALDYAAKHPYTSLRRRAHRATVDFIENRCPRAIACRTPRQLADLALARTPQEGIAAEFGVFRGASLRYIARNLSDRPVHGFDSFEGLPEPWIAFDRGAFSADHKLPRVPNNVQLWKGWFSDTLPRWREQHNEPIAFLHVDCDLHTSTETVLEGTYDLLSPGSILLFDDYFNFPNWEREGHEVFERIKDREGWSLEYLGYSYKELAIRLC